MSVWRPIETAPKDGGDLLGWVRLRDCPDGGFHDLIRWTRDAWRDVQDSRVADLTHWMPLPPPPTTKEP